MSGFKGTYHQYGSNAALKVNEGAKVFGGRVIADTGSSVDITSDNLTGFDLGLGDDVAKFTLGKDTKFINRGKYAAGGNIDNKVIPFSNEGAALLLLRI